MLKQLTRRFRLPVLRFATVLDGRRNTVSIINTLLLAASWRQLYGQRRDRFPLTILVLDGLHLPILSRLEALGASVVHQREAHRLDDFSGTYNKLLALDCQGTDECLALLDNDIVLLRDMEAIHRRLSRVAMAGLADKQRVPDEIRTEIRTALSLRLPVGEWAPWKPRYDALEAGVAATQADGQYFNSGVVCFPPGGAAAKRWEQHADQLGRYFGDAHRNQRQRKAFGSDQLPLSTALAAEGCELLPQAYNYRVFNFLSGDLQASEIHLVHHVGIGRYQASLPAADRHSLAALVRHYYEAFMLDTIRGDRLGRKQARAQAVTGVRDAVLAIIHEQGIDDLRALNAALRD